jgi:hypothetical protein
MLATLNDVAGDDEPPELDVEPVVDCPPGVTLFPPELLLPHAETTSAARPSPAPTAIRRVVVAPLAPSRVMVEMPPSGVPDRYRPHQ